MDQPHARGHQQPEPEFLKRRFDLFLICWCSAALLLSGARSNGGPPADLTLDEQQMLLDMLDRLDPLLERRRAEGTATLLLWSDLLAPLTEPQRRLVGDLRVLAGNPLDNEPILETLVPLSGQPILIKGMAVDLPTQYLFPDQLEAYRRMSAAMEADLGTSLRIESAFRSSAYQMALFLGALPEHGFSISETRRHVALPGQSEHNAFLEPAVDFISVEGENGAGNPFAFEVLREYRWLRDHARDYGFELSHPKSTAEAAYEPWHWRYCGSRCTE